MDWCECQRGTVRRVAAEPGDDVRLAGAGHEGGQTRVVDERCVYDDGLRGPVVLREGPSGLDPGGGEPGRAWLGDELLCWAPRR